MVCVVPPEQHSSWIGYKEKRRWHPNEKERVKLRKNERCEVRYGSLAGKCRDLERREGLAGRAWRAGVSSGSLGPWLPQGLGLSTLG